MSFLQPQQKKKKDNIYQYVILIAFLPTFLATYSRFKDFCSERNATLAKSQDI